MSILGPAVSCNTGGQLLTLYIDVEFETQAEAISIFFYLNLYYFNHVSTTGRAFL